MPFDPKLGTPEQVFVHLEKMLDRLGDELLFWQFDDLDDPDTCRIMYSSHAVSPITQLRYADVLGETMYDAFPGLREGRMADFHREVLRKQEPAVIPLFRYGDERVPERWYRTTVYPVTDRMTGVWIADVTSREQAEREREIVMEQLDLQARELDRSNQELEEFAYVASHDLKAPLRDIENLASWIAEDAGDVLPEPSARHLRRLTERVQRMQTLLDDLLDYSRAGRVTEHSEELAVSDLLRTACELINAPSGFDIALPDDAPAVRDASAPLQRVFMNLIGNAIKHHDRSDGRIEVSWTDAGDRIEFAVSDDGPGIPEKFHERVVRLFTTLRPRDQVEGSGMGLALVKKLVESRGGALILESPTIGGERGTTFRFTWPRVWSRGHAARSGGGE